MRLCCKTNGVNATWNEKRNKYYHVGTSKKYVRQIIIIFLPFKANQYFTRYRYQFYFEDIVFVLSRLLTKVVNECMKMLNAFTGRVQMSSGIST